MSQQSTLRPAPSTQKRLALHCTNGDTDVAWLPVSSSFATSASPADLSFGSAQTLGSLTALFRAQRHILPPAPAMLSSLPRNLARPSATASRATALRSAAACFSTGLPSPTARLKSLNSRYETQFLVLFNWERPCRHAGFIKKYLCYMGALQQSMR